MKLTLTVPIGGPMGLSYSEMQAKILKGYFDLPKSIQELVEWVNIEQSVTDDSFLIKMKVAYEGSTIDSHLCIGGSLYPADTTPPDDKFRARILDLVECLHSKFERMGADLKKRLT